MKRPCPPSYGSTWRSWRSRAANYLWNWATPPKRTTCPVYGSATRTAVGRASVSTVCRGGHEFTSFVLGLYNAAGPGQALDEESRTAIQAIQKPVEFQVLVSLSCTMCPELVTAAQRMAAENPNITAQVYDLNHFPDLRERYQVMSVPCLVVNGGEQVSFGKKNVRQLLELLNL